MSFNLVSDSVTTNTAGKVGLLDTGPGDTGIVAVDAYVYGDDIGLQLNGGEWKVTINGTVIGGLDDPGEDIGIYVAAAAATVPSSITVGATGDVGGGEVGILADIATNITNSGLIGGGETGIGQAGPGSFTIKNNATGIIAGETGFGIYIEDTAVATHTITNAGEIVGGNGIAIQAESLTTGVDKVSNSGLIDGSVLLGGGDDTFANSGEMDGNVDLGDGNNTFSNSKLVDGNVFAGIGNDKFTNAAGGTIDGIVDLGGGVNSVSNAGKIEGNVTLGNGGDTVGNSNLIDGSVFLGTGNNTLNNSKTINGSVIAEGGNDTITNKGTIGVNVLLDVGTNKLTNAGKIGGDVEMGGGSDSYIGSLDGINGTVTGTIDLGAGADTVTGGGLTENVMDGDGADILKLGAGNDVYIATGAGADGTDTVDGGTGAADVYDASNSDDQVFINLDTLDHKDINDNEVVAKSAYGLDVSGFIDPDDGKDIVTNIENVIGGIDDDIVFGSAVANGLAGSAGDDTLYGFAGADTIDGGGGADTLVGGAGKDVLSGGGVDMGEDLFVYLALADSGTTAALRDIITDFEVGVDKLDFSLLADALSLGLAFKGMNTTFSGSAGSVRAMLTTSDTLVQIDIQGDNKADFAIALEGHLTLTGADFIF